MGSWIRRTVLSPHQKTGQKRALTLAQSPTPQRFRFQISPFVRNPSLRQAVVDLLVMRELLCSEARSVTFSFMHDCFSSISISAGRHQQHRQDCREGRRMRGRVAAQAHPRRSRSIQKAKTVIYFIHDNKIAKVLQMDSNWRSGR